MRAGQRGTHIGFVLVLLLIGHLSIMAFPSQTMGQEMLSQEGSDFATVASDEQVAPPPPSCPGGPGDCMLAWSQAMTSAASPGSIDQVAVNDVLPEFSVGSLRAPFAYGLSPPRQANLQVLLQVFRS